MNDGKLLPCPHCGGLAYRGFETSEDIDGSKVASAFVGCVGCCAYAKVYCTSPKTHYHPAMTEEEEGCECARVERATQRAQARAMQKAAKVWNRRV